MMRRITLSTSSQLMTRHAAPASFATAFRPSVSLLHTSSALFDDKYMEEQRARKRQQMEDAYTKDGKLPEVNPASSFSPRRSEAAGDLSTDQKESITRASNDSIPKPMNDDFADENSAISDANMDKKMKSNKSYDVADAPPMAHQRRSYSTRANSDLPFRKGMENSIVSEAVDNEGDAQTSKTRGKMNKSEHNQKYKTRGNFTEPALAANDADILDQSTPEWSGAATSTKSNWASDSPKYKAGSEYKNNKADIGDSQQNQAPHAPNSVNLGQFDVQQKRGYSTDSKKSEAIIGDSPHKKAALSFTDFLGEKPMEQDTKGTQAKKNSARFGPGWEKNIKESEHDFASGAAGAPAKKMRDKQPNYKKSESQYSSESLETDDMNSRGKLRDVDSDAISKFAGSQNKTDSAFTNSMRDDAVKNLTSDK